VLLHLDLATKLLHFLLQALNLKQQVGQALFGKGPGHGAKGEEQRERDCSGFHCRSL
jgi:hypothetical protein